MAVIPALGRWRQEMLTREIPMVNRLSPGVLWFPVTPGSLTPASPRLGTERGRKANDACYCREVAYNVPAVPPSDDFEVCSVWLLER